MARELNSEEAKILVREDDFEERLENNALARLERSDRYDYRASEFSRRNEKVA